MSAPPKLASKIVPGSASAAAPGSASSSAEASTSQQPIDIQDATTTGGGERDASGDASAPDQVHSDFDTDFDSDDEDDDPNLLASYPIYLSNSIPPTSELQLFQYPTYPRRQPLPVPLSSRQRGLQQAIRWRKQAGWVQVELPLDLRKSVYDEEKGNQMGRGAQHLGKEIGQSDGEDDEEDQKPGTKKRRKDTKKGKSKAKVDDDDDLDDPRSASKRLEKIRLESDLIPNMTKYCVGVMRDQALHLTQLDRVVQLRPSMHHLDGLDAIDREDKRSAARYSAAATAQTDDEESDAPAKAQQKKAAAAASAASQGYSVSVRVAGSRDGAGPSAQEALMAAQHRAEAEKWLELKWKDMYGMDRDKRDVQEVMSQQLFADNKTRLRCVTRPADYLPAVEDEASGQVKGGV